MRGAGDSCCSGGNIKGMKAKKNNTSTKKKVDDLINKQISLTGQIYRLKIPTIAVITGPLQVQFFHRISM